MRKKWATEQLTSMAPGASPSSPSCCAVLRHRAVLLLTMCFLILAACGQNTGSGEKSEQATAGLQGPAGPGGLPGPQGPAGPPGENGSVIHFQQVGCSTSLCTIGCKEGERLFSMHSVSLPGGTIEYSDERHLTFRAGDYQQLWHLLAFPCDSNKADRGARCVQTPKPIARPVSRLPGPRSQPSLLARASGPPAPAATRRTPCRVRDLPHLRPRS